MYWLDDILCPKKGVIFWGCQLRPASTSKIVIDKENPTTKGQYTSKSTNMREKKSLERLLSENFRNFHNEKYFVRSKCRLKYVPSEWPWVAAYHGLKSRYQIHNKYTIHLRLNIFPLKVGLGSLCYCEILLLKSIENI